MSRPIGRPPTRDPYMTVEQIAEMFQVSRYTVREWLKAGNIKAAKFGKEWRARQSDVNAYAQSRYGAN